MAVNDAQIQSLIVLEVGDEVTAAWPSGILSANIATVWASYADKALIAPRLQELYSKRRCIDIIVGIVRGQVTFSISGDHSRNQSDKAKALMDMRRACQDEITLLEAKARANRAPANDELAATAPIAPPDANGPDANDSRYRGDPYKPPFGDPFRRP